MSSAAVVLVHMLGRDRRDWEFVAEALRGAGISALAIDLRGHGESGGSRDPLGRMEQDVAAAVRWLAARQGAGPGRIGIAGASLGASLALQAAAADASVRSVALLSPSLDYRGVRINTALVKKYGARPLWLLASSEDPYALRTVRDIEEEKSGIREERISTAVAHGTNLLRADPSLIPALVDWFRRTLIF